MTRREDAAMDHAQGQVASANGNDLDPDIRRFIRTLAESVARLSGVPQRAFPADAPLGGGSPRALDRRAGRPCSRRSNLRSADATWPGAPAHSSPGSGELPGLVYLHGGGWTLFSIDTHDRVMREYAARAGCCVIGVDYALSPESKFPVAARADRRRRATGSWSRAASSASTRIALRSAATPRAPISALRPAWCGAT